MNILFKYLYRGVEVEYLGACKKKNLYKIRRNNRIYKIQRHELEKVFKWL
jgi:hypothetical protein